MILKTESNTSRTKSRSKGHLSYSLTTTAHPSLPRLNDKQTRLEAMLFSKLGWHLHLRCHQLFSSKTNLDASIFLSEWKFDFTNTQNISTLTLCLNGYWFLTITTYKMKASCMDVMNDSTTGTDLAPSWMTSTHQGSLICQFVWLMITNLTKWWDHFKMSKVSNANMYKIMHETLGHPRG